jgi:hypothetical protein
MHNLIGFKSATQCLFYDVAVLQHFPAVIGHYKTPALVKPSLGSRQFVSFLSGRFLTPWGSLGYYKYMSSGLICQITGRVG